MKRIIFLFFFGFVCLMTESGCSSIMDSHTQKTKMLNAYIANKNAAVLDIVNDKLKEPKWYNSSRVNTGDELMWRLESGSINFHIYDYKTTIRQFDIAERLIYEYDERARISLRDTGAEVGSAVTNPNAIPYRGYARDRIALSMYKSLAYLGAGDENAFRAQLKRMRQEQKNVQEEYRSLFEEEDDKLKATQSMVQAPTVSDLTSNRSNSEFAKSMNEVTAIAHEGYKDFLNPAALWLSAIGSMRDGNYDNARIDFAHLCEAMPNQPVMRQYYATALNGAGRSPDSVSGNIKPFSFPIDHDCLFVLFANGRSGALRQITLSFPVVTAWPVCEFYPAAFSSLWVVGDGVRYTTSPLANMDGIMAREYQEHLPGMIARIVVSTMIKEGLFHAGIAAAAISPMSSTARALAISAIAVGGTIYRDIFNTADTRSWELLPKEFQLTQMPMPKNRQVTFGLNGGSVQNKTINLPKDCKSAILFVEAPSSGNVVCHVLPFYTK